MDRKKRFIHTCVFIQIEEEIIKVTKKEKYSKIFTDVDFYL